MKFDSYYEFSPSEGYKNLELGWLAKYASAITRGLISNLKVGKDNYSSITYIAGS